MCVLTASCASVQIGHTHFMGLGIDMHLHPASDRSWDLPSHSGGASACIRACTGCALEQRLPVTLLMQVMSSQMSRRERGNVFATWTSCVVPPPLSATHALYRLAGGVFRRHLVQVLAQQCNHARAKRGAAPCLCRQVSVAHVMQKPVARAVLHVDPVQVKNLQKHSSAVLSVSE